MRWIWICQYHHEQLEPSGHGTGFGGESWPGISYFTRSDGLRVWQIDTSELSCQGCTNDATDEEIDKCWDSWEMLEVPPISVPPTPNPQPEAT